jgi:hypothetical protein
MTTTATAPKTDMLVVLGALFALTTLCKCDECFDAVHDVYFAAAKAEAYGISFRWENGTIQVVVRDRMFLALHTPKLEKLLQQIEKNFTVIELPREDNEQ